MAKRMWMGLACAVLALGFAPAALAQDDAAPADEAEAVWPAADPADVATLDSTLATLYAVISGPAGARDWDRFRSLFIPEARLIPIGMADDVSQANVLSVDGYVERADAYFSENGFFETEIFRVTETYGALTHAFSTYESRTAEDEEPFARGVNSFSF